MNEKTQTILLVFLLLAIAGAVCLFDMNRTPKAQIETPMKGGAEQ